MRQWLRKRRLRPALRRTDAEWVAALRSEDSGPALEELRAVLVARLDAALRGRVRAGVAALAEDFAQEALLRILDHLDTYRGEAAFLTWAQKVATRVAVSELRRKRWRDVSLDDVTSPEGSSSLHDRLADDDPGPAAHAEGAEHVAVVMAVIAHDLSDRQRAAIEAVMLHGMPIEVLAERLGSNRNAVYKLLHDARKRIKAGLAARGLRPEDLL
jgi:RNA polymerase sigma-70 factor, ECF subfamily